MTTQVEALRASIQAAARMRAAAAATGREVAETRAKQLAADHAAAALTAPPRPTP